MQKLLLLASVFVSMASYAQEHNEALTVPTAIKISAKSTQIVALRDPLDGSVKAATICFFNYPARDYERTIAQETKFEVSEGYDGYSSSSYDRQNEEDTKQLTSSELITVIKAISSNYTDENLSDYNRQGLLKILTGSLSVKSLTGDVVRSSFTLRSKRGTNQLKCVSDAQALPDGKLSVETLMNKIGVAGNQSYSGASYGSTIFSPDTNL